MFAQRKTYLILLAIFAGTRVLATVHSDGPGGLLFIIPGVGGALVVGFFYVVHRRRAGARLIANAQASGQVDGAAWVGYVQQQPPGGPLRSPLAGFKPSYYRSFASGLLSVHPEGIRFDPAAKAVKNGHQPWGLPWASIEAVQQRTAPGGSWLYIGPRGGDAMELATNTTNGREFTQACAVFGAHVLD